MSGTRTPILWIKEPYKALAKEYTEQFIGKAEFEDEIKEVEKFLKGLRKKKLK